MTDFRLWRAWGLIAAEDEDERKGPDGEPIKKKPEDEDEDDSDTEDENDELTLAEQILRADRKRRGVAPMPKPRMSAKAKAIVAAARKAGIC